MTKIVLLFLITIFNFVVWYWTTTPYFAILQIHQAIRSHDLKLFEQYVDTESLASSLIDGFLSYRVKRALGHGLLGRILGSGFVDILKPQLVDMIRDEVGRFVETNKFDLPPPPRAGQALPNFEKQFNRSASPLISSDYYRVVLPVHRRVNRSEQTFENSPVHPQGLRLVQFGDDSPSFMPSMGGSSNWSLKGINKRLGFSGKVFKGVKYLRVRGGEALIGLSLYNERYKFSLLLELRMQREGDSWRLVEVSNLPTFLCQIIELKQKHSNDSLLDQG